MSVDQDYKLFCYYENWAAVREGVQRMRPADVNPFLCTHLLYAFAKVSDNQLTTTEDFDLGMLIS